MHDANLRPLDYELPKTPKDVMDSWMPRLQAVAVVTALFAAVEAQLLGSLPDHGAHPSAADTLLRFFGYSGLFFNLGATLSAILLLVAVASLPTAARQVYMTCSHGYPRKIFNSHGPHVTELNRRLLQGDGETYILRAFGIAKGWGIMLRHCILCFLAGCVCCFLHVGINLWLSESKLVAAIIMPSAVFGSVPPLLMFSFYMDSPACDDCIEERSQFEV